MSERPAVSVTTVTYNSASCVGDSLRSICDEVSAGFAELIVVDNNSPDDSLDVALAACPQAQAIRSPINRLFAGGCNLAWPHVRGRYWLLLNPDVIVPSGGLRELVAWMDSHPELGAASPRLVGNDGSETWSPARRFPSLSRTLVEMFRFHRLMSPERRADFMLGPYWHRGEHLDVDWVIGAAVIARREAVEAAGLLAEASSMYTEDSEWCWRIGRAGFRIGLMDGTPWRHTGAESTGRTWNEPERLERIWCGVYESAAIRRGRLYSWLLWVANVVAFGAESIKPFGRREARCGARRMLRAHLDVARLGWRQRGARARAPANRGAS